MLTMAPLPTWRNLLGIFVGSTKNDDALSEPWRRDGEVAGWFSRSAWSLARIFLWRKLKSPDSPGAVWLPDYFCNCSLTPLRAMGAKLIFYPLTSELQPNYSACRQLALNEPPALFVLVHYFGGVTPAAPARELCVKHGAWLVEDAAHSMRPVCGIGEQGDFVLYSPHKHLPIPDGAMLVARPNGPSQLGAEGLRSLGEVGTWGDSLAEHLGNNKLCMDSRALQSVVWLGKRTLQKLGIGGRQRSTSYEHTGDEASAIRFPAPVMSWLARRLLARLIRKLADASRWRQRNLMLWDELLLGASDNNGLKPVARSSQPYLASFEAVGENAKVVYEGLQQQGLPVMTWPDLAPEVANDRPAHENAWALRHHRIYLPLHQSIGAKQLISSISGRDKTKDNPALSTVRVIWDKASRPQWQEWMALVGQSNLLQSWEYGDAKAAAEGWRVCRGVFFIQGDPVAIVQALEKRLLWVRVLRINRGPLFLRELPNSERLAVLKRLWGDPRGMFKKTVYSVTPELTLSGEHICLLASMDFLQFSPRGWTSIWVELKKDEEALRKQLNAKWRNMLVKAEKQNITFQITGDSSAFEWLLDRCMTMMIERNAGAIPLKLYRELQQGLQANQNPLFVLRAFEDEIPIAGICVVPHGNAATYLLGWNSEQGRRLNANYLLLWQAIVLLKRKGFLWFDLGGVNNEETPGIGAFKQGIHGVPYELVGTYWR